MREEASYPDLAFDQQPEHDHQAHNHIHEHGDPVISRRWQWITVFGNAAVGVGELMTGNLSTLSATTDGIHNMGDMTTYYMQAENVLNKDITEQKRLRMRKIAHWIIATTSVGAGVKAGMDLGQEHTTNPVTVYWAGASLALSGLMLTRLRQGIRRKRNKGQETVHERDLEKHFWKVDIPSAACAVAGAALQKYNVHTEQVLAIANSGVAAWAFRPTKKNMSHDCLGGLFDDGPSTSGRVGGHASAEITDIWTDKLRGLWRHNKTRLARRRRFALGVCAASLALGSSLLAGDAASFDTHPERPSTGAVLAAPSQSAEGVRPAKIPIPITTHSVMLQPGDTQWGLVKERLRAATGESPKPAAINAITMFVAIENKKDIPNPNVLQAGQKLQLPTIAATRLLDKVITSPKTVATQVAVDLDVLNAQSTIAAVFKKEAEHQRITRYLQASLVR